LKTYYKSRTCDWLKLKKYYLQLKPIKIEVDISKIKQNLKVTFNESPDIRRVGETASRPTAESTNTDRVSIVKTPFINDEARNLYNGLMIRNYKI
jgi:hypothetical protein